jgi:hypothetical protein
MFRDIEERKGVTVPAYIVKTGADNFLKINLKPSGGETASHCSMKANPWELFDEEYRVVSVESQSLTIQGVRSGQVLTIVTQNSEAPLTPADYPPGKLIALSDPLDRPVN